MTKVFELYGLPTFADPPAGWPAVAAGQHCPYLAGRCLKPRKSDPAQTIGTCTVALGRSAEGVIICPHRLRDRSQIFTDGLHLLTRHEPGNELHIVPELAVPGGSIDYCLVSVRQGKVADFAGIELQTLDTTGTVWPERQRFLKGHGVKVRPADAASKNGYGMNWKMTAKTTLVQLHHKIGTFEHVGKHLVLVVQDHLLAYMRKAFAFDHLGSAKLGDPMHFHAYGLAEHAAGYKLELRERVSTDRNGIARCLNLQGEANVELGELVEQIEGKLTATTVLRLDAVAPPPDKGVVPSE